MADASRLQGGQPGARGGAACGAEERAAFERAAREEAAATKARAELEAAEKALMFGLKNDIYPQQG